MKREDSPEPENEEDDEAVVLVEEDKQQVMSEVHLGCPPGISGPHISHFTISPLSSGVEYTRFYELFKCEDATRRAISVDEDGDLVLIRRSCDYPTPPNCRVNIQHNITSSIPSVGLQLWRAELVLSDFVLHKMFTSSDLDGIISLDLGAGTGLVGILLASVAKTVFLTDHGDEILENCAMNVQLNSGVVNYRAAIQVRELDWLNSWPPTLLEKSSSERRYSWTSSEVEEAEEASLLVAADVIYSDDLTDALFSTLRGIMSQGPDKVLYLALERRYNFSLDDLDIVANGYSHFQSYFREKGGGAEYECLHYADESAPHFVGKRVDLMQIPQYVVGYDRGSDVELWQIQYNRGKRESIDTC